MGKQTNKPIVKAEVARSVVRGKPIPGARKPFLSVNRIFILILAVISILIYANTGSNGYVLDDSAVIQQNIFVARGLEAIPDILSTPYHEGFMRSATNDTSATNDLYRPMSLVLFAAERQFFGETPEPGHIINIGLFAVCVVLLFLFLDVLFHREKTWVAFIAALLFAVHPIHTEVVANIKSADELLCFIFASLTLLLYIRYVYSGRFIWVLVGSLCFMCSLLAKETSISLLGVIPLVFFFYINEDKKRSSILSISPLVITIIYLFIRFSVLRAYNADAPGHINFIDNELAGAPSVVAKIATIILIMGYYVKLLFVPYPLSCNYSFKTIPFVDFSSPLVWLSLVVYLTLATIGVVRLIRRRRDIYAFGILYFLLTIALFSNVLFLVGTTLAERFLFFPSVGFCLILAQLIWTALAPQVPSTAMSGFWRSRVWLAVLPLIVVYSFLTITRNPDWESNFTLFRADLAKYPQNAWLWSAQGTVLTSIVNQNVADTAGQRAVVQEGVADYHKSIAIYPDLYKVHNQLGNVYMNLRKFDSAAEEMKMAVTLAPNLPDPVSDLGSVYFNQKQYKEARIYYKKALFINPRYVSIINNLAICYYRDGLFDSCITTTNRALAIDPENALAKQVRSLAIQQLKPDSSTKQNL